MILLKYKIETNQYFGKLKEFLLKSLIDYL